MESSKSKPRIRFAAAGLIVLLAVGAGIFLSLRLWAGLNYLSGKSLLRQKDYAAAAERFETALEYQPNDPSIWKGLGAARRGLSGKETIQKAFEWEKKAREALLTAARLNPLDSEAFHALAMVEQSLERLALFAAAERDRETFDAEPYFKEAIRLRPNSSHAHFSLIRRLHFSGRNEELLEVIERLLRIHPAAMKSLEKELFWSPQLYGAAKKGLRQAIADGTDPWSANKALSSILADEEDWAEAISFYQRALGYKHMSLTGSDYSHLGRLQVENGQYGEAAENFVRALVLIPRPEEFLEVLYKFYKTGNALEEFDAFLAMARQSHPFTEKTEVLYARALIDQERLIKARRVLDDLNRNRPVPEAYHWLSRLEERENDPEAMESAMREAVRLDSNNVRYHRRLAGILRQRNKPEMARKHDRLANELARKRK